MFSPNPISKRTLTFPSHSFKFLLSVLLLSMEKVLQSSFWFSKKKNKKKNMLFKMVVQGSYWAALILHLLGCLWKWLFGVKNILSRVSSTKHNSAEHTAWSITHWWPNEDSLRQSQQKPIWKPLRYGKFHTSWLLYPKTHFKWSRFLDS